MLAELSNVAGRNSPANVVSLTCATAFGVDRWTGALHEFKKRGLGNRDCPYGRLGIEPREKRQPLAGDLQTEGDIGKRHVERRASDAVAYR